jgi:hypothetical protein
MALWRTDRRWQTCWSTLLLCWIFNWRRMAGGFCLHELFEGDVCGYRTCSMLMAKVLFDRENLKDKNRRRCFQGYQGDIGCPTGESSRTIVFYLVSHQNFSDFRLRPYAVLRRWYEAFSFRQGFSGLRLCENLVGFEKTVRVVREKFIAPVELAGWNCAGSGKLYKRSGGHNGRKDEFFGACGRLLRCWALSEDCHYRVQRSIQPEVTWSLHVFGSFETGVCQLCMAPMIWRAWRQSWTCAETVYTICSAWFGLDDY